MKSNGQILANSLSLGDIVSDIDPVYENHCRLQVVGIKPDAVIMQVISGDARIYHSKDGIIEFARGNNKWHKLN